MEELSQQYAKAKEGESDETLETAIEYVLYNTELNKRISQLTLEPDYKGVVSKSRIIQNLMLVWFLNQRVVKESEANWDKAKLYSLSKSELTELKDFMYAQLAESKKSEDSSPNASTGEV